MDEPAVNRHLARAALYGLCAGLFLYPERDRLAEVTDADAREGARSAADTLGLHAETDAVFDALDDADVDELSSVYDSLFGIPTESGRYAVTPYEAEYTEGDDIGHQQRRIASVVGLLDAVGLQPSEDFDERQDHVAVELETMQVLAAQRAVALHQGDAEAAGRVADVEETFLDRNLRDFVPAFAHGVREATDDPTYRAAARLASRLVRTDLAARDDVDAATGGASA